MKSRKWTHQLSFCVKKLSIPANLINCGNAPVNPNESGNHAVSHRIPKRDSKKRWPKIIWRARASPEGMFASVWEARDRQCQEREEEGME